MELDCIPIRINGAGGKKICSGVLHNIQIHFTKLGENMLVRWILEHIPLNNEWLGMKKSSEASGANRNSSVESKIVVVKKISLEHRGPANSISYYLDWDTGDIFNAYILGKTLRKFAFGSFVQGIDKATGEKVVCKIFYKKKIHKENVSDVIMEIKIMLKTTGFSELESLKSIFEDDSYIYMILDYCSGGDLFEEICLEGRMSEPQASRVFKEMLECVQKCHSLGIIHRNLTPQSFKFSSKENDGRMKLANFEAAALLKSDGYLSDAVGNPYYISPEVIKNHYNFKADIWSLGVNLYAILSEDLPFHGGHQKDLKYAIADARPDFERTPWDKVSDLAKDLVMKLLSPNTSERITLEGALDHPWIRTGGVYPGNPSPKAILIALSREKIKKLRNVLKVMDANNDGKVTYAEFKAGLSLFRHSLPVEQYKVLSDSVQWNFKKDFNYEEFVSETPYIYMSQKVDDFLKSFKASDDDEDGSIPIQAIRESLEADGELEASEIETVMQNLDVNHDGEIDYTELLEAVKVYNIM